MAAVKPRMAVAYHFFNDFDTRYAINDGIRSTYDGPLTLATDLLVWNITKDDMRLRQVIVDDYAWPAPPASKPGEPDKNAKTPFTDFINSGRLDVATAFAEEIAAFKKKHGLK
jgi:ribonuclease Z